MSMFNCLNDLSRPVQLGSGYLLERTFEVEREGVGLFLQHSETDVLFGVETEEKVGHLRYCDFALGAFH